MKNDHMKSVLERLHGQLIVSCQASVGSPFRDPLFIRAFARAAVIGGAAAVRIESLEDVETVRAHEQIPIIGLIKRPGLEIYITPYVEDASSLCGAGADMVAFDATQRTRSVSVQGLIQAVQARGGLTLADVSTVAEGVAAVEAGATLVSTTMSGYTPNSPQTEGPDFALIRDLVREGIRPVAEGRYQHPEQARMALDLGAYAVVVGSAITRPEVVTSWFSQALRRASAP